MTEDSVAGELEVVTRADRERAWRAQFGAAFLHASAVHANTMGWPVEAEVLDELEVHVRLERIAHHELRQRAEVG